MRPAAIAALVLASCLPAAAQYAEIGVTVGYGMYRDGEIAGYGSPDSGFQSYSLGDGVRIGARMSFDFKNYFANEISYAWQNTPFQTTYQDPATKQIQETRTDSHHYYYNFVVHMTDRETRVRPFVTGGVGVSTYIEPGASSYGGGYSSYYGESKFGYNYGAGIKFLLTSRWGLRFDVRDHLVGKPYIRNVDGRLHDLETSATFSYLF